MKFAIGFYRMGCNKFNVTGMPNMTTIENKNLFKNFEFKKMSDEQILAYFNR